MHPFEPVFTVYDGQVAYVMRIEMQPELPGLLSDKNLPFFLMRFVFSFPGLSNTLKLNAALAKELLINIEQEDESEAPPGEDHKTVLLNFKLVLFCVGWSQELSLGQLCWLAEFVNDCMLHFLKLGQPKYALHTLMLAESLFRQI